jgi:hypothetical protein
VVVDGDVGELPAGFFASAARVALTATIAGDAMADGVEAAEFFDIDVDDLAGCFALVTWPGLLRLEARKQTEAAAPENARDAGPGDGELAGDVLLSAALTPQDLDRIGCGARDLAWR